jgi:hypothetical protein
MPSSAAAGAGAEAARRSEMARAFGVTGIILSADLLAVPSKYLMYRRRARREAARKGAGARISGSDG